VPPPGTPKRVVAEDQTGKASTFGCYPAHIAPDPLGPSHGWSARRKEDPLHVFRLCPTEPHGDRPGHQALAAGPHPRAWLQGEAPVSCVRTRDDAPSKLIFCHRGSYELFFVWSLI